ncbi:MAG: GlmL-related ornithine degradation protein [Bacillota bacterium]|nr:GlmL-related ornithine degradation protein [Bacillota bacterium]
MNGYISADVLVAEIGSTTTIVNAFAGLDTPAPQFLGQGMAPTSVQMGDVTIGLQGAVEDLERNLKSKVSWQRMLATSSAAGGLRMTVHGLAHDMTARAAREAALGAGAIVKMVTAGELQAYDLEQIKKIKPNIILLAGGVDYGERNTAIANAKLLADLGLNAPIVYAGNVACRDEIVGIIRARNQRVIAVDNVYPRIDELNIEPTRAVIQQVFEEHIVHAPGMERIREMVQGAIMPTPGAVMQAAQVLYRAIGDVIILDVGGATTDVHSVTPGSDEMARLLVSPEPLAKRTVEGDLGVYVNVQHVADLLRPGEAERAGIDIEDVLSSWQPIPTTTEQFNALHLFTKKAVETALDRHSGRLKHLYGPGGRMTIAQGKDLTSVKWVIGTGGPLTKLPGAVEMLKNAFRMTAKLELFPKSFAVLIDHDYNLGVLGVLSQEHEAAALALMKHSINYKEV